MVRQDPLFKGCTRPAMIFGVPIVPLAITSGTLILFSVWTTLLLTIALIPTIWVMRLIAKKDDQQFRLSGLKLWCRYLPHYNRNKHFWKASAYTPINFGKK